MDSSPAPLIDNAFFNGPDWRWKAAQGRLVADAPGDVDQDVLVAAQFMASRERSEDEAVRTYPLVAAAAAAWQLPTVRRTIQLMALADGSAERIARRLGLDAPVVQLIERLFCDVRSQRTATDWIHVHVIAPLQCSGEPERVIECRAALFGDAVAAEWILDCYPGVPWRKAERLGAAEDRLRLKLAAALEMPLTPDNLLEFMRLTLDYELKAGRLALDKQRFAHSCERAKQQQRRAEERQAALVQKAQTAAPKTTRNDALHEARRPAAAEAAHQRALVSPLNSLQWKSEDQHHRRRPTVPIAPATPASQTSTVDVKPARRSSSRRARNPLLASAV